MSARRVIGFAHRGAPRSKEEHNTLEAFERALALGALGLESDVALTSDGVPVLWHRGIVARGPSPARLRRDQVPASVPSLADLYRRCGHDFDLSLDMAAPEAAAAVVKEAERHGALDRLWLTYWRLDTLQAWRARWPSLRLVYPAIPLTPGRRKRLVERLVDLDVTALNVFHRTCTPRVVQLAHQHGLTVFAWGIRTRRPIERVLAAGVDGVFCDDVECMVHALHSGR